MRKSAAVIAELQEQIDKIAGGHARKRKRLPFGLPEIDDRLNGGLAFGSTHEIAGGGTDAVTGATAPLFAAGISIMPSERLPAAGVGRPRWLLELMRARAGECFDIEVGACDERGRLQAVHAGQDQWRIAQ